MNEHDAKEALKTFSVLCDTREKDTESFRRRIEQFNCPTIRKKLDFGDYSAQCILQDGTIFTLEKSVVVERKEHFDELAICYTSQRERFTNEFERAKQANAKIYLLVEKATWEKAYAGIYRSRMTPQALVASLTAWFARYDCKPIFCQPETSGKLIRDILQREMKEALLKYEPIQSPKRTDPMC